MSAPSRGHELFEQWLIDRYGASTRSRKEADRPLFVGMRKLRSLIAKDMRRFTTKRPPKALSLYHYLASASDKSRKVPRVEIRVAIEQITGIPREAWLEEGASQPIPERAA